MDSRVKALLVDTSKADRIRAREMMKNERERQFAMLKNSTLPVVEPDMRIKMNLKCETCNEGSERFTKRNDWIMDCIDLRAKLQPKKVNVFGWIKDLFSKKMKDPIIAHPANFVMLKNVQVKYPDVPIVFVMRSCLPNIDLQLVENILSAYDIKLQAIISEDGDKPSESILSSVLQKRGNILLALDELDTSDMGTILKACNFGLSVKIFMLPIIINSESYDEDNRGIIKVSFFEPYTVDDILRATDAQNEPEEATTKIFDHLNYDVTMNSPVMSTSLVSFLLMTKFRKSSTTFQELYKASDELLKLHPMLDYAFEGKTKDIVDDGIEILSEH